MNELFTNNELKVMNLFWDTGLPLTSVDVLGLLKRENWKQSYAVRLLNILETKGAISVCGTVRYKTQYARQFQPVITREEYAAQLAITSSVITNSFPNVAVSMVGQVIPAAGSYQDLVNIIDNLKGKEDA